MKYSFDYAKLIDRIYEKGHDTSDVLTALGGVSEHEWLRKIAGLDEFTQKEIHLLAEKILEISPTEIPEYFFKTI